MVNGPVQWPLMPRQPEQRDVAAMPVRRLAPGFNPADPLRLTATWSSEKRRGRWAVPPYITVVPNLSNVVLDLRDAVTDSDTIHLSVEGVAANTVLIVPVGWGIDTDRLGKGIGSVRNRIGPLALPGYPLVVVSGTVCMGAFVARRERFYERWGRGPGSGQPREILR